MIKIEYEIKLNESGRPCIELSENYENKSEDKFFALEMTRYFLQSVMSKSGRLKYNEETLVHIDNTIQLLGQVGDEMAEILWKEMKTRGELNMMTDNFCNAEVNSIEERDALNDVFAYGGKILERKVGLKILVREKRNVEFNSIFGETKFTLYELKGGITNEYWTKFE